MDKEKSKANPASDSCTELLADKDRLIDDLRAEIVDLAEALGQMSNQLEEVRAQNESIIRKNQIDKLMTTLDKAGHAFDSKASREIEIHRLMALSEDAFNATTYTLTELAKDQERARIKREKQQVEMNSKKKRRKKSELQQTGKLNTEVWRQRTHSSDRNESSLEEKLTRGFMAAYKDRAGIVEDGEHDE